MSNILDFPKRHAMSKTVTLSTNYRCSQEVVHRSEWVISHNKQREKKEISPRPDASSGYFQIKFGDGPYDEAQKVVDFLQRVKEKLGCPWRELAVLCRYKDQQPIVALALDQRDIPRTPLLTYKLFTSTPGNVLRGYLGTVLNPEQSSGDDLRGILNRPNHYLSNDLINRIAAGSSPWSRIEDLLRQPNQDITDSARNNLGKFHSKILNLHVQTSRLSAESLIDPIVAYFGLQEHFINLKDSPSLDVDQATDEHVLNILVDLSREYLTPDQFYEFLCQQAEKEYAKTDMVGEDSLSREVDASKDQVVISTIHAAKGREYQGVVLFNYVLNRPIPDAQIEEERRVFYVGMTRAIHSLFITTSTEKLHPFVKEAYLPPAPTHHSIQQELDRQLQKKREIEGQIDSIKQKIADSHLDIEAINSGEYERQLNQQLDEITRERDRIRRLRDEWERRQPDSWLKRIFVGGLSQRAILERCRQLREEYQTFEEKRLKIERALRNQSQRLSDLEQRLQENSNRQRGLRVDLDLPESHIDMLNTISRSRNQAS